MKNLPLLVCAILAVFLLPWNRILPEPESPYPNAYQSVSTTLTKYRQELASKNLRDDSPDDFIIRKLGRAIMEDGSAERMWKEDPTLMQEYANIEWANRKHPYFMRLFEKIYGDDKTPIWKSNAWVVLIIIAAIYAIMRSLIGPKGKDA